VSHWGSSVSQPSLDRRARPHLAAEL
jgi:hypothetical protein